MSSKKDYLSLPLNEFLADTAARSPTPGGGSVAAVVGGLAVSLACMAIEYTVGKPKFAEYESRLRELLDELKRAGIEFGRLVAADIEAYEELAASRDQTEDDRSRALNKAIAVPMEIVALAGAITARLDGIKACVNPFLLSDLRASATLAEAAACSAASTVRVNLAAMTDRQEAGRLEDRLDLLLGRMERHRNAVVHFHVV